MKPYGHQFNLKKKGLYQRKKNSEKISILKIKLINQIFDTINISLLVLIFTLFFLSFDSQRKWSYIYKNLSKTRASNNNLIDYISRNFTTNYCKRFRKNPWHYILSFYLCFSSFKFRRDAAIICSRNRIRNHKSCFREFVFFSDYAFLMEWLDLFKFVFIEDLKNLIFTCESNKKMFI